MKLHLEKAQQNERFLELIKKHSNNEFSEWKITVVFYIALHLVKALCKKKSIYTGNSHSRLETALNESSLIPDDFADNYHALYENSRTARYSVYYKNDFQRILTVAKFKQSEQILKEIKSFVNKTI